MTIANAQEELMYRHCGDWKAARQAYEAWRLRLATDQRAWEDLPLKQKFALCAVARAIALQALKNEAVNGDVRHTDNDGTRDRSKV